VNRRPLPLLLALLTLAACSRPPVQDLAVAAPFRLPDLAGGSFSSSALQGKVVVLDFWATWCGPCIREIPEYTRFWERNRGRGVEVVGVVFDSGEAPEIEEFVREHRIPYRQLLGTDDVLELYGATEGFPTTFVIDESGRIRTRILGALPDKFERLQASVDAALAD